MTEREIEVLTDSYERCVASPDFFETFYRHFLASSEAVAEKFVGIDMKHQQRAVRSSLYLMISAVSRRQTDFGFLEELAERHSRRGADIQPYLYDLWVASLLHAVGRCDPLADAATEAAWRLAMRPAVEYLVSRY